MGHEKPRYRSGERGVHGTTSHRRAEEAERNLRRAIELDKEVESKSDEAADRQELGRLCPIAAHGRRQSRNLTNHLN